jgi:hypothetical protein
MAAERDVIETCEPCTSCGEVPPHSRRRIAPLRWLARALGLLAALLAVVAIAGRPLLAGPVALLLALAVLGLLQVDRARRWDLACTRCRGKAVAGARPAWRRWRLPLRATTIDPF